MVVVDAVLLLLQLDNWSFEISNIRTWKEGYQAIQVGDVQVVLLAGLLCVPLVCIVGLFCHMVGLV